MATEFEYGFLVGLLVGEGHFGGDGLRPHITLRMHVRHEALFRWLEVTFPGGKLYGPYHHGGRNYYQWMVRGPYLRDVLLPLLDQWMSPELDGHSFDRLQAMRHRYQAQLRAPQEGAAIAEPSRGARPDARLPAGTDRADRIGRDKAPETLDAIFGQLRAAWPAP